MRAPQRSQRGAALLAVLWLSAALSAIAFSVASTVRGETERAATSVDDIRSYYIATGAIQRALLYREWGPDFYKPVTPAITFHFPAGDALVEIIPETAKLGINGAKPESLYALLLALGANDAQAGEITAAIIDWRTPSPQNRLTAFDSYYLTRSPSFRSPHASFEQIEELLSVRGMTPDLFYGTYERDMQTAPPRLVPRGGLRECISIYGTVDRFDVNTGAPALLLSAGLAPAEVAAIVQRRAIRPFSVPEELKALGAGADHLSIGGNRMSTFRATARLRLPNGALSDMRRTVSALIRFMSPASGRTFEVIRWYDRG